jgi:hypothetical protein
MIPPRLRRLIHLLGMRCEEVAVLTSQSLDRELPHSERTAVALHFMICLSCRRYRRQLVMLRGILRNLGPDSELSSTRHPNGMPEQVRERIKNAIRSESF